jgi:hypothetical protein
MQIAESQWKRKEEELNSLHETKMKNELDLLKSSRDQSEV